MHPVVGEIDHRAAVRMSATSDRVAFVGAISRLVPDTSSPMQMVGDRLDETVGVAMVAIARARLTLHSRDDVPEMSDDRIRCEQVAVFVEVGAPRIDHALCAFYACR